MSTSGLGGDGTVKAEVIVAVACCVDATEDIPAAATLAKLGLCASFDVPQTLGCATLLNKLLNGVYSGAVLLAESVVLVEAIEFAVETGGEAIIDGVDEEDGGLLKAGCLN